MSQFDLRQALRNLDIEVKPYGFGMDPDDDDVRGYSCRRWLAINPQEQWPVFVTFHEIAHILLGHGSLDQKFGIDQARETARVEAGLLPSKKAIEYIAYKELNYDIFEAECHATAILAAQLTDTPFDFEAEYEQLVGMYTHGRDIPEEIMQRARKNAEKIALAGRVDERSRRGKLIVA